MKYERMTQWVSDGASLILDNPRNVEEAKEQLKDKFKLACIKLATLEDKIESGELVEAPKGAVVLTPEERSEEMRLCNEERKQAVREFADEFKRRHFFMMTTYMKYPIYQCTGDELDRLVKEECGE